MHEVLVNRLGGLSLPRKSVVRLTDRPDMTLDVYRGRKTTNQQSQLQQHKLWVTFSGRKIILFFSCSTQLSMKYFLLITIKMPTTVGILTFMSRKTRFLGLSEPKES